MAFFSFPLFTVHLLHFPFSSLIFPCILFYFICSLYFDKICSTLDLLPEILDSAMLVGEFWVIKSAPAGSLLLSCPLQMCSSPFLVCYFSAN